MQNFYLGVLLSCLSFKESCAFSDGELQMKVSQGNLKYLSQQKRRQMLSKMLGAEEFSLWICGGFWNKLKLGLGVLSFQVEVIRGS